MRCIVHGAAGRMGRQVIDAAVKQGYEIYAAVDPFYADHPSEAAYPCYGTLDAVPETQSGDVIIDFSHHATTNTLLAFAKARSLPVMIATTGQTEEEKEAVRLASTVIPVFRAANMSLGIATLCRLVRTATCMFPDADIEIVEQHHNQKLDVPSGTALTLAETVKKVRENAVFTVGRHENGKRMPEEIGIHSLRLGNVVGVHEVIITTGNETITLKHEAHSRAVFADGAVLAAAFLADQTAGLYTMEDLVDTCR